MTVCTSELQNLSVEAMNSIVKDIKYKLNWSSPYRSVFVIGSKCFGKMFSSIFLILIN